MRKLFFYLFLFSSILLITCQKELSYETGGVASKGSLLDDGSGDCLPKTVNGSYIAGTALSITANTIQVTVNVTRTGSYTIFSDTVNGYYFRATGIFSTVGSNSVTVKGFGNPSASGVNNFLFQYDSSACNVAVTVLPAGSGPAAFTIQSSGTPAVCSASAPTGNYIVGTLLNSSNTDTFNVNVTTVGSYIVTSDTVNGIYFNGTGTFAGTGAQQLILNGHGTPTAGGTVTLHIIAGSSTCSFQVTITSGAVGTLGGAGGACTPSTINGTYTQGTALTVSNTVQVQINVTTAGTYSISTNTVSGFSFAASGTAATGTQLITLNGTGTPTASGAINFTVTFGSSTCSFTVNVTAAPNTDYFPLTANSWWSYDDADGIFVINPGDSSKRLNINSISFSGVPYRIFQNFDNTTLSDSFYYRRSGNNYLEYNITDFYTAVFFFDTPILDSILFLKEGLNTGDVWESKTWTGMYNGSGMNGSLKYADTCYDANGTATINGHNFTNVYKIKWRPKINIGGGFQDEFIAFESWFAKGVGLIYFKVIDLSGSTAPADINILHWQVF